jgi:uncharacterized protein (TIGR00369 family)
MTSLALSAMLRTQHHGRLDMLPYGQLLDISFERTDSEVRLLMPFKEALVGSPGRLHGGSLAGLLELAGLAAVVVALPDADRLPRIRPINITVDFMREGTPTGTMAAAEVTRLGRRVVNVASRAWQYDRGRPIAAANVNFLLDYPEAQSGT